MINKKASGRCYPHHLLGLPVPIELAVGLPHGRVESHRRQVRNREIIRRLKNAAEVLKIIHSQVSLFGDIQGSGPSLGTKGGE